MYIKKILEIKWPALPPRRVFSAGLLIREFLKFAYWRAMSALGGVGAELLDGLVDLAGVVLVRRGLVRAAGGGHGGSDRRLRHMALLRHLLHWTSPGSRIERFGFLVVSLTQEQV